MSGAYPKDMTPVEFFGTHNIDAWLREIAEDAWRVPTHIIEDVCRRILATHYGTDT